jgi:hypothetical protein
MYIRDRFNKRFVMMFVCEYFKTDKADTNMSGVPAVSGGRCKPAVLYLGTNWHVCGGGGGLPFCSATHTQ